jgi:molybdopterin synthase sulfur carrier subunit
MPTVTMRYWAAAKHAAGVAEETLSAATLAEALAAARSKRSSAREFEAVLARSSFLVDGQQAGGGPDGVALRDGAVVEVLPPFAGG